jgi:hypothetical protein
VNLKNFLGTIAVDHLCPILLIEREDLGKIGHHFHLSLIVGTTHKKQRKNSQNKWHSIHAGKIEKRTPEPQGPGVAYFNLWDS